MAIQLKTEFNGILLDEGYFKITNVSANCVDGNVYFAGSLWANQEARNNGKEPVIQNFYANSFTSADKTGNLVQQAYDYINELAGQYGREQALFGEGTAV